jgi:3'-phosphoadenosine 5'-phosphosulfate sulfotransferase (PAPS reductase)/FAD synthetase
MSDEKVQHILGLSGGKDSAALAIYMRDRVPEMQYIFTDTDKELPETYEFLAKLEAYLGKPIIRLNAERGFDHWLQIYGGYLPSSRMRWCTRQLKLKPFEAHVGDRPTITYIGIRADEDREGYISTKPNITAKFPFKEGNIRKADVFRILEEAGVGLPEYYKWRSRSGCYFCFFQRKEEWVGLLEHHPELFEEAKKYEKLDPSTGERYTWQHGETLDQMVEPARLVQIRSATQRRTPESASLVDILDDDVDEGERPCMVCDL